MATLLRLAGHEVRTAYDGQTALALARLETPELVLCDINMPGMSGYQLASHLRAGPRSGRHCPGRALRICTRRRSAPLTSSRFQRAPRQAGVTGQLELTSGQYAPPRGQKWTSASFPPQSWQRRSGDMKGSFDVINATLDALPRPEQLANIVPKGFAHTTQAAEEGTAREHREPREGGRNIAARHLLPCKAQTARYEFRRW